MNAQLAEWAKPENVVLAIGLIGLALALMLANRRGRLDLSQMFKDGAGATSAGRVTAIGAFIVSSWIVMKAALANARSDNAFGLYLVAWSGSMVLSKAIDHWRPDAGGKGTQP